jgi:hypothetical protein
MVLHANLGNQQAKSLKIYIRYTGVFYSVPPQATGASTCKLAGRRLIAIEFAWTILKIVGNLLSSLNVFKRRHGNIYRLIPIVGHLLGAKPV